METFIEGYAAIFGAYENGVRIAPRCSFVAMGPDLPLTVSHLSRHIRFATMRAGTLEVFTDRIGLGFSMAVDTEDASAGALLTLLSANSYCSYLGAEETRDADDGVKEIVSVSLHDLCLTGSPWFSATGAWRSDADTRDMPAHHRRLRWAFEEGIKKPHQRMALPTAWSYIQTRSTAAARSASPRALARRPAGSPSPAAAADRLSPGRRAILATGDRRLIEQVRLCGMVLPDDAPRIAALLADLPAPTPRLGAVLDRALARRRAAP